MDPGLAGLRQFLIVLAKPPAPASHASVRSTTHPRGNTSKRWLSGLRRTTVSGHPPVDQAHSTNRRVVVPQQIAALGKLLHLVAHALEQ